MLLKHDQSYEFSPSKSVAWNVNRVWQETTVEACELLSEGTDFGIHETRKRIKKLRALLYFLGTGPKENTCLRNIARSVGDVRDAASMVECAQREFAGSVELETKLKHRLERIRSHSQIPLERLVEELKGLQLLVVTPSSFSVANGAETVFNRGLKCLETVKRNPSVENFHELRKATKNVWYVLCMVYRYWEPVLGVLQLQWKALCDLLGRHHDLALLHDIINRENVLESREQFSLFGTGAISKLALFEVQILDNAELLYSHKFHEVLEVAVKNR